MLGAAEAGFFPGIILYLTWWYPSAVRTRIIAYFITAIPVAGLIGGPISGWIMQSMGGLGGLKNWQWLFLLEGAPCFLIGCWVLAALPDRPQNALWLDAEDRQLVVGELDQEARSREAASPGTSESHMMGLYQLTFWLLEMVKSMGWKGQLQIGCATAVPWLAAVVFMIIYGVHSDRTQERRIHSAVAALIAAAGFVFCGLLYQNTWAGLAAMLVAAAGVMSLMAVQWSMPSGLLGGVAAAAGIALINSCGNLGGFVSPVLTGKINEYTKSGVAGQYLTAFFLLLAAAILFAFPALQPPRRVARETAS